MLLRNKTFNTFQPELIAEITSVCNRACAGCYAPNTVSSKSRDKLYSEHPRYFITEENFHSALSKLQAKSQAKLQVFEKLNSLALRGGEPSLHPKLSQLLKISSTFFKQTFLETHGRWILELENPFTQNLLQTINDFSIVVKISFDRMHGMNNETLRKITDILNLHKISWIIAITEPSEEDFNKIKSNLDWISDHRFIYQPLATNISELIKPILGVIHVNGFLSKNVFNHFEEKVECTV